MDNNILQLLQETLPAQGCSCWPGGDGWTQASSGDKHHPLIASTEGTEQKLLNSFLLLKHFCSSLPRLVILLARGSNTLHRSKRYLT